MASYKIRELIKLTKQVRKYHILDKLEEAIASETDVILGAADTTRDYAGVLAKINKYWGNV